MDHLLTKKGVMVGTKVVLHVTYPRFNGHRHYFGRVTQVNENTIDVQFCRIRKGTVILSGARQVATPDWGVITKQTEKAYVDVYGHYRMDGNYVELYCEETTYIDESFEK